MIISYPETSRARDEWILAHRPSRNVRDPWKPYAFHHEEERAESGELVPVATIFLTNRECPWRCVMCDLWRDTLTETVPAGAIPAQIDYALSRLPPARHIKLYNAGSFFDARAIPPDEYVKIAERLRTFERVIVECHPALISETVTDFHRLLGNRLEIAMGLETAHPEVLEKLNKHVTLERFSTAANFLRERCIPSRIFILVQPPFISPADGLIWTERSIDFAANCGASVVSLIPTRGGNGAMEALASEGHFESPRLSALESAQEYGINLTKRLPVSLRVFADLWDLERLSDCPACFDARRERLDEMNRSQRVLPSITCDCGR